METVQKLFGKKPTSDEMVRKWQRDIRTQQRSLERQIKDFNDVEKKTIALLKQNAKKNDNAACKLFAKELVRTRRQKQRLYTGKAQLNSINLQLQHQLATVKLSGTLKKSTDVMKMVNGLTRLPEISKGMQELSMEMTKAGIMDEMIEDTFEGLEESDVEEEAEQEVNNVLFELTNGLLGEAGNVGAPLEQTQEEEEEPELDEMQARLQALKS
ncbi:2813_t:CDS:2 [Entrophospora sp. SA101]|nr:9605_t:CDS:2 [Entrophospora candida]CAH1769034.1 2780_t:CDS:2 [Entrophospora sp. SA101]CAJ0630292.1 2340_t:CDS:2 [Entrophospora sp. SA101]CAJ0759454.1 2813_t:CDS:2 [Entrophospora sp. SA101]CAJ0882015.1 2216_t:CDS:2 [Entrophospora sp. SA101]